MLFLLKSFGLSGQVMESSRISNTETATLMQYIKESEQLVDLYPDSAKVIYEQALLQSKKLGLGKGIRNSLLQLVKIDVNRQQYDAALKKINDLIRYCDTLRNRDVLGLAYTYMGVAFQEQDQYQKSFEAYSKALTFVSDSFYMLGNIYRNMGELLRQLQEEQKAILFYDKAIAFAKTYNYPTILSSTFMNKAVALVTLKEYKQGEQYLDSAISQDSLHQQYESWAISLLFKGDMYNKRNLPERALEMIKTARLLLKKHLINFKKNYLLHIIASDAYLMQKRYKAAESHLLEAKQLEHNAGYNDRAYIIHRLSEVYSATGRYKEAYALHLASHQLLDSIRSIEIAANVSELETKYRSVAKDKEIAQQQLRISESQKKITNKNNLILLVVLGSLIVIILGTWRYMFHHRKRKQEKELEHLKGLMIGEERERSRLAHDLHDGINSQLTAIQSFLLAEENLHPFLATSKNYNSAQNLLLETASGVREIAHNLAPEGLQYKGLTLSIKEFCEGMFTHKAINADVQIYGDFSTIPAALALSLYRVVQELVQNMLKHSDATEASILLCREGELIMLTAEDNGKGIAKEILQKQERRGIGLSSLQDRVKMHQGTLQVESTPEQGTTIHITFPVVSSTPKHRGI